LRHCDGRYAITSSLIEKCENTKECYVQTAADLQLGPDKFPLNYFLVQTEKMKNNSVNFAISHRTIKLMSKILQS
jgi:hypothetical protein